MNKEPWQMTREEFEDWVGHVSKWENQSKENQRWFSFSKDNWEKHPSEPRTFWKFAEKYESPINGKWITFKNKATYDKWIEGGGWEYNLSDVAIPEEHIYFRKGGFPNRWQSISHASGKNERGISVYYSPRASSLAGIKEAPWYYGKGKQVNVGSDDEPVIIPIGKWKEYKGHKQLVEQALSEGKPVPPEVLKDYPDLAKETPPEIKVGDMVTLMQPTLQGPKKQTGRVTRIMPSGKVEVKLQLEGYDTVELQAVTLYKSLPPIKPVLSKDDYVSKDLLNKIENQVKLEQALSGNRKSYVSRNIYKRLKKNNPKLTTIK